WLLAKNIKTQRASKKLDDKKIGPYVVKEKISPFPYRLDLLKTLKIHDVFHVELLTPVTLDTQFSRTQPRPPPVATEEGEEVYEVMVQVGCENKTEGT